MRIDSAGNVGIGTTDPTSGGTNALAKDLVISRGTGVCGMNLIGSENRIWFSSNSALAQGFLNYNQASNFLGFGTNNTERMRIDSTGNVGIGTSSPTDKLRVDGTVAVGEFSQVFAARANNLPANPKLSITLNSTLNDVGAIYCLDLIASFGDSSGISPSAAKLVYMFTTSRTGGVTTISNITNMQTLLAGGVTSVTTSTSGNVLTFTFTGANDRRVSAQGRIVYGNSRIYVGVESATWS
jgi:hypothetical protein